MREIFSPPNRTFHVRLLSLTPLSRLKNSFSN
jgi:hypothetical protein